MTWFKLESDIIFADFLWSEPTCQKLHNLNKTNNIYSFIMPSKTKTYY